MSRNILYYLVIPVSLMALLAPGCANTEVTFEQLFTNPSQYNGKDITIEGFVFLGWEVMVLCEQLVPSGYAEGHLVPKERCLDGRCLWIEGGIPRDVYDNLYEQNIMTGPPEQYGKVLVRGMFQYGGQYGHVGGYECQIIPSEMKLLPWSPP